MADPPSYPQHQRQRCGTGEHTLMAARLGLDATGTGEERNADR